ncbi:MAG: Putative DNA methylase [Candidatus Tokpelaia hoelldobleri]|uniref:site-specific DNA-methyltransferase (adenine-specific) n=1 Tax=Candidatus Tokpelaia hoelldobleri TaxID=1902579 RepID=A0A1U9JT22_9HYPH|nr:MAG: Putative DNA methylase [Candidatus Tokpelaia hoelldoblerii]
MNPVEMEQAVAELAQAPFDAENFPYSFLEAFGNTQTTIKKLKKRTTNASDLANAVLQRNNIHIATVEAGEVDTTLAALRESPKTVSAKAKFILATDGDLFAAEELASSEAVTGKLNDLADHFGFFLPLAGITTLREITNKAVDIKATGRLNRLYIELLKENPDWGTDARRHDFNQFMVRLIFCFFAEDTDIFNGSGLFTQTVVQMSAADSSDTHEVIGAIFQAMNIKSPEERAALKLKAWANKFPYVNGGLFSGMIACPKFSRIARSYLIRVGELDWKEINPDIFGSMVQAIADEGERGKLGMHYTSVPNILKVLNPLFLDDLRLRLQEAGDNPRKLLNLRQRLSRIRVFDPACGSGNFLVIAYKEMREIEAEINKRRGESDRRSQIPLTNFRGIEYRDFPAEIARLALIIAEYQCDVIYRGQREALAEFLPLNAQNWITCGNALRLDWLSICPPTGTGVKLHAEDLFHTPLDQAQIDFENEDGETYICGNPPYVGSTWQTVEQKDDLKAVFGHRTKNWKSLDYVTGWFLKAAEYAQYTEAESAFVATNSICQGQQVAILWPLIFAAEREIAFAYPSFKWSNLASHNAGVTVVIVGLAKKGKTAPVLFENDQNDTLIARQVPSINAYLVPAADVIVEKRTKPIGQVPEMIKGNQPTDGGNLLLSAAELEALELSDEQKKKIIRRFYGSEEFINGKLRYCLWIKDDLVEEAKNNKHIAERLRSITEMRLASPKPTTKVIANKPYQFGELRYVESNSTLAIPRVSSEARDYLPVGYLDKGSIISDSAFGLYDAPLWNMALIASRLHLVWIGTVCGKLKTDFRYSNTLGWNTFPVPTLTEKNRADLTHAAEEILLAREAHYPATIADLYKPDSMPEDLRAAHKRNDEILERIYIGRRFKNDTERLEKLFELYTKMTAEKGAA